MVTVRPATVIVPVRFFGFPTYGATVYSTVPVPEPVAPVMVIHGLLLVAVHVHPGSAVTLSIPLPADAE